MTRNLFRFSFAILFVSYLSNAFGQDSTSDLGDNFKYSKADLNGPTINPDNTIWLNLASEYLFQIRSINSPLVSWSVLLPGEGEVELTLLESCPFQEFIPIGERSDDGLGGVKVTERFFTSDLQTFDVTGPGIGGSMVISDHQILASIRYNNRLFELRPVDIKNSEEEYVLFDVNDSRGDSNFSCAADDLARGKDGKDGLGKNIDVDGQQKSLILDCVEIGIDIDNYTYNTFGNCDAAIIWSLAILAGVDEIYRTELNDMITLSASYINIWQTVDPYASIIEDAGTMLDQLRSTWMNDATLSSANHDLVHLLTKRADTGTGGIAWLDGVCNSWGVAFSAHLDNNTTFSIPNYSWNLNVVGHELGHNFGAHHTHWCGWPGGPIDNCGNLEGSCSGYTDNPTPQLGTMMSYCHAISGGSVTLQFHNIVETNALIPTLTANGSCHGGCDGTIASCGSLYGCTDSTACNYDPSAEVDDGSCDVIDVCGICAGGGESCTGCTDPIACNYMEAAIYDDGSCVYPPAGFDCNCASDINVVASLTASQSSETSIEATGALTTIDMTLIFTNTTGGGSWAGDLLVELVDPNGQCIAVGGYNVSSSCSAGYAVWPSGWNVTPSGTYTTTIDFTAAGLYGFGQWTLRLINGWTSSSSVDYDMTATLGGVCIGTPDIPGCTDATACNYDSVATSDDGSCEYSSCAGCTDSAACNYDSTATLNNGSCEYTSCAGCTNNTACNYDSTATIDDGSCEYVTCQGCTDSGACNYDSTATLDDGSCEFTSCDCPEDINGDGSVTVADVLIILGEFNCLSGCTADVDGDGAVTVSDLLLLLAAFGTSC